MNDSELQLRAEAIAYLRLRGFKPYGGGDFIPFLVCPGSYHIPGKRRTLDHIGGRGDKHVTESDVKYTDLGEYIPATEFEKFSTEVLLAFLNYLEAHRE